MIIRHLESTFCDDIRQEISGKMTFVGVYGVEMVLRSLPLTIPKLCVVIKALATFENAFKSLRLRILLDDDILVETEQNYTAQLELRPDDKVFIAFTMIVLSPLEIKKEGTLRVRGYDENGAEYAALGLRIRTGETH